jgi:hypothetical protein
MGLAGRYRIEISSEGIVAVVDSDDRLGSRYRPQRSSISAARAVLDETRRVAINIAKLPELVKRPQY